MRVALLGDLVVRDDGGRDIGVTGSKQRALLALLALHAGRPVSADHLVDALWGEDPPEGVRNGLQGLVSKLRRAIGDPEAITMRGGGYVLDAEPEDVDVHRFEQLVVTGRAQAEQGDTEPAIRSFVEADGLWRGAALAEFAYDDFASTTIARLDELRASALEERFELELQVGRHHAVIPELETWVERHPLRERLRGLLMLALYRAGRQVDALRVFQEGRRHLSEELGLDPGPELRALETAILAHDPSLAGPTVEDRTAARSPRRSVLPASVTALIGRSDEVAELSDLVRGSRLVTLVGPGGVGKTRLALEVARRLGADVEFGACLVELAPVSDEPGVLAAIAAALDVTDPGRLTDVIGDRELLVVLDNCEHVIDAAAAVAGDLLGSCAGLRLLATSREGLRVVGETVWPVPPLARHDAVDLFVDRARAAGAKALTEDVMPLVVDICERLDGLPLAIELAAARTRAFSVAQLASRLDDRFRVLTGGARNALPRQQTLRAVVDWSYELLFEDEQKVFERLAVLPGGCDLATAEVICADDALDATDVDDIVSALVDKSLVAASARGESVRYTQLQTLSQYGVEKLAQRGDAERVRDLASRHFADLCRATADAYVGDQQRAWLGRIDQERDNLRAALEWALANDDAETALVIAGGASWAHWLNGTIAEGKRWIDDAFGAKGAVTPRTRAIALIGRGLLNFQSGQQDRVDADLREAVTTLRELGDVPGVILGQSFYAEVASVRGDLDEARQRRTAVLDFYRSLPDDGFVVPARAYSRAKLAVLDGDLVAAEEHYREATAGFARIDRPVMSSMCLGMVADFDERAGKQLDAIDHLEQAIATNESLGLGGFTGSLQVRLAWLLLQRGDLAAAETIYAEAVEHARWLRNLPVVALGLAGLSVIDLVRDEADAAVDEARESLDLHLAAGPRRLRNRVDPDAEFRVAAATCCDVLAIVSAERSEWDAVPPLLAQAEALRAAAHVEPPELLATRRAAARDGAKAALGDEAFAAGHAAGREGRLGAEVSYRR